MSDEKAKLGFLDILIIVLSVYVLIALLVDTFLKLPLEISRMLMIIDDAICVVFLFDFLNRLFRSRNKLAFMKWGWIDLISSIPYVFVLRAGRLLRLVKLLRVLRAFRSTRILVHHIFKSKIKGTMTSVAIVTVLVIIFSCISILVVETEPGSNIKSAEDAVWWTVVTVTTVGYGDKFPVTTEGRIIGMVVMIAGVGLIGAYTGFIASLFVGENKEESKK